ncbi:MAG TPA: hypothetical protein VFT98_18385 [Myxococcota bacterium]|nr:hypothetical protein [Myxococcota bacterium]
MRKWVIGFFIWLALVVGAAGYVELKQRSYVGGGLAAKEICSCMHIGGRDFEACRADLAPFERIDWLQTSPLPDGPGVQSGLRGFEPRIARFEEGKGCTLEP